MVLLGTMIAGGLVATSPPAAADFHFMLIREVGIDGPSGQDFVELQMYPPGQTQLSGHSITLYDNGGSSTNYPLTSDVSNGVNQATILIATTGFTGPTPDFGTMPQVLSAGAGAVCFENIDCVEWGSSNIPTPPSPTGNPATAPAAGQSLERTITPGCPTFLQSSDDTDDSATDFAVQATPNPEPNSATPNEQPCAAGTPGGKPVLQGLKAKARGNRATISGRIEPPSPGDKVTMTFFANGSPLRKVAKKSDALDGQSKFKKSFRVPGDSTRCKVKVAFKGQALGQKKFRC